MLTYYYPRTIKNVTVALMDMFNDLIVYKYDSSGTSADVYTVPITFGPVEKEYQARVENSNYISSSTDSNGYTQVQQVGQRYWVSTPRLALVMNGIAYNADRAYGVNEWREWFAETLAVQGSNIDQILMDYQPTPYDINYTLHIMTDSMDYFSQIMENILPYFNPALFLRVKEFSFLNIERDLRVTMPGVIPEFLSPEIAEEDRRYVNATMDLTVEAWMYRPFEYDKIIKIINSKYFVVEDISISTSTISALDTFSTSGFLLNTSGALDISAFPDVNTYSYSGTYIDNIKNFDWFTSATPLS